MRQTIMGNSSLLKSSSVTFCYWYYIKTQIPFFCVSLWAKAGKNKSLCIRVQIKFLDIIYYCCQGLAYILVSFEKKFPLLIS